METCIVFSETISILLSVMTILSYGYYRQPDTEARTTGLVPQRLFLVPKVSWLLLHLIGVSMVKGFCQINSKRRAWLWCVTDWACNLILISDVNRAPVSLAVQVVSEWTAAACCGGVKHCTVLCQRQTLHRVVSVKHCTVLSASNTALCCVSVKHCTVLSVSNTASCQTLHRVKHCIVSNTASC